jgi:hypothetical protein
MEPSDDIDAPKKFLPTVFGNVVHDPPELVDITEPNPFSFAATITAPSFDTARPL